MSTAEQESTNKHRFIIQDFSEIDPVACPCGATRRALACERNKTCTLHMVEIDKNSKTHYHKKLTEVYYVLQGKGSLELNGERFAVKEGMVVLIPPGTRHRAVVEDQSLRILNYVTPPFDPADEWFD